MLKYFSALMTLVTAQRGDVGGTNFPAPEIWTTEAAMNSYIASNEDASLMERVDKVGTSNFYGSKVEIEEWDAREQLLVFNL